MKGLKWGTFLLRRCERIKIRYFWQSRKWRDPNLKAENFSSLHFNNFYVFAMMLGPQFVRVLIYANMEWKYFSVFLQTFDECVARGGPDCDAGIIHHLKFSVHFLLQTQYGFKKNVNWWTSFWSSELVDANSFLLWNAFCLLGTRKLLGFAASENQFGQVVLPCRNDWKYAWFCYSLGSLSSSLLSWCLTTF